MPSLLVTQITSASYEAGTLAADTIGNSAHGTGSVVVISVTPGITTTDLRTQGFVAEMQKKFPQIQVLPTQFANDELTTAATDVDQLSLAHPNLVGVFGVNSFAAQGAAQGVVNAHRQGSITVVGFDAPPVEVNALRSGSMDALVVQDPAKEGELSVQYAVDYLNGDRSAIPKSVQLNNVVATRANMNSPSIEQYFYAAPPSS